MTDTDNIVSPHLNRHPNYPAFRFRDGIKPYPVTELDPSIRTCIENFGRYEYGLIAVTTLVPAYLGYSGQSIQKLCLANAVIGKLRSFPVYVGLTAGFLSGLCYAYAYAYCTQIYSVQLMAIFYS